MSVYVDNARLAYRRMKMCHMVADTLEELHQMADTIGIRRKWFQAHGHVPHYDISLSKREAAIRNGAVELNQRGMGMKIRQIKHQRNEV